jgi:hypothetical protein
VLILAEGPAVAGRAVEVVVKALGDLEEAGITVDHQPSRVDPDAAHVRQQDPQHLGDAAARCRRVDAQDGCPVELFAESLAGVDEGVDALSGNDLGEHPRILGGKGHLMHLVDPPRGCRGRAARPSVDGA